MFFKLKVGFRWVKWVGIEFIYFGCLDICIGLRMRVIIIGEGNEGMELENEIMWLGY